jgi:hypothetical protein
MKKCNRLQLITIANYDYPMSGCRGIDFSKSVNQIQELPMVAMFVDGSGQNEQSLDRTFLSSFASFI